LTSELSIDFSDKYDTVYNKKIFALMVNLFEPALTNYLFKIEC